MKTNERRKRQQGAGDVVIEQRSPPARRKKDRVEQLTEVHYVEIMRRLGTLEDGNVAIEAKLDDHIGADALALKDLHDCHDLTAVTIDRIDASTLALRSDLAEVIGFVRAGRIVTRGVTRGSAWAALKIIGLGKVSAALAVTIGLILWLLGMGKLPWN